MSIVDPAEVAAEMLREALPGFAALIDPMTDRILIRGSLKVAAGSNLGPVYYHVPRDEPLDPIYGILPDVIWDGIERGRDDARRKEIQERLEPFVSHIADNVRRLAIEATGLEAMIVEREKRAAARERAEILVYLEDRIAAETMSWIPRGEAIGTLRQAAGEIRERGRS